MNRTLATTIALGLAGFDPLGGITFTAAAGLGARRRSLALLGLVSVGVTAGLSILAVLGLGPWLHRLTTVLPRLSHHHLDLATRGLGAALIGYGCWRLAQRGSLARSDGADKAPDDGLRAPAQAARGMAAAGVAVGLSSLVDPAWYAMVAFGAGLSAVTGTVVALAWTVMSHILLVVLTLSLALGWQARLTRVMTGWRTRWARPMWWAVTAAILIGGGLLAGWGLRLFGR